MDADIEATPEKWATVFDDDCCRVEISESGKVHIYERGVSVKLTPEAWVRLAKDGLPESEHIDAMFAAIRWHFPPHDAMKVRERYRELIRERERVKREEFRERLRKQLRERARRRARGV